MPLPHEPNKRRRILRDLQISEVSAVRRGAGEGCRIVLAKAHRDDKPIDYAAIFGVRPRRLSYDPATIGKYRRDLVDVDAPRFQGGDVDAAMAANGELDGDTTTPSGGAAHIDALADLLVEAAAGQITRQQALHWLMHDKDGRALARHAAFNKQHLLRKEQLMTITEQVRKAGLDPIAVCKTIASEGKAYSITEHELTTLIQKHASANRLPGESAASAFARVFSADDDTGLAFRKAIAIAKGGPQQLVDTSPSQVGGAAARDVNNPVNALAQLRSMAERLRRDSPERNLSSAAAFSLVYTDPADAELARAERGQNRPTAIGDSPRVTG